MALTVRTNGSSTSNIITAQWFNDYYNLLTGSMQDQNVLIKNTLRSQAIGAAPASAPTLGLASGTSLSIGVYKYVVTFTSQDGESLQSGYNSITTTSGNQVVSVSSIPTGPTGTTGRKIYRTTVGGNTYYLDKTLSDNTSTSYQDTTADAGLGAASPSHPSFGGSLIIQDSTPTTRAQIYSDGYASFTGMAVGGALTVTGQTQLNNALNQTGGQATFSGTGTAVSIPNGSLSALQAINANGGVAYIAGNPGTINRIAYGFSSVTTGGTTITHNLGVLPSAILMCPSAAGITFYVAASVTTTTFTAFVSTNNNLWWLAIA